MDTCYAYVGLGSNMGDKETYLQCAVAALGRSEGLDVDALSPLYETEPQDMTGSWFLNQVARLTYEPSLWSGRRLVLYGLQIERDLGRERHGAYPTVRFESRCIDVDVLFFGHESSLSPECIIPHPRLTQRAFVLVPLQDVFLPGTVSPTFSIEHCLKKLLYRVSGQKIFQNSK